MSPDFSGAEGSAADEPAAPSPRRRWATLVLLVVPVLATLAIPLYARQEPRLSGVPFFYWYQFASVLLTALCLAAAHSLGHHDRPRHQGAEGRSW